MHPPRSEKYRKSVKLPVTVQDLVELCRLEGVDPAAVAVVLRQPCGNGSDDMQFLVAATVRRDIEAVNLLDEHQKVAVAISLDDACEHFYACRNDRCDGEDDDEDDDETGDDDG